MAPKRVQGKGKAGGAADQVETQGWRTSECSDFHLLGLVEEDLLQSREVVNWRKSLGESVPRDRPNETIIFHYHVLHGLGIPTSNSFEVFCTIGAFKRIT